MHAQVMRVLLVAGAPDVAEELAVGDDFAAMLEEEAEAYFALQIAH